MTLTKTSIRLPAEYVQHFKEMAREADMPPASLLASLLRAVADDDRAAHGRKPIKARS